jgi:hypothetical protein
VKRKGKPERVETFSMADAQAAGLAAKETYQKYPRRMCGARCRSWALRGEFSDVLKGLQCREEVEDYEQVGETADGVTIMRPRRRSEVEPLVVTDTSPSTPSVDAFTQESGPSKVGAPAPLDRSRLVKVLIKDSIQKTGNGKTFYSISYETPSGGAASASTFDSAHHEAALKAKGAFALISTKESAKKDKDGKPYVNLVHIEAAAEDEAVPAGAEEPGAQG